MRYPNGARIWNYHLRGKDHFAIDRQAADNVEAMAAERGVPSAADMAVEGRHLLQRMVDYMLSQGIRQFLDLGSGLPNMANTHQIAHRTAPEARVLYVDSDPMVRTHAAALLTDPHVATLQADLREPEQVLGNAQVRSLIDFDRPVGILFICLLHCMWDKEDPWAVVRRFRDAAAPGSYLAVNHLTNESYPQEAQALFQMTQDLHWNMPLITRTRADITRFFDGFTLVEPGLVPPAQWRPELDNPLRGPQAADEFVIPEKPRRDSGAAWNLSAVGIKP
jgi:hypothetical protein